MIKIEIPYGYYTYEYISEPSGSETAVLHNDIITDLTSHGIDYAIIQHDFRVFLGFYNKQDAMYFKVKKDVWANLRVSVAYYTPYIPLMVTNRASSAPVVAPSKTRYTKDNK